MSPLKRWLNRSKLRGAPYKLIALTGACFTAWLLIGVIFPALLSAWSELATRTPLGSGRLVPISISADHLSPLDRSMIKETPQSVAAHQVKPSLKLLGIGQRFTEEAGETSFIVGLLPDEADKILKSGTKMSFRVEAPSLELLTQELIYSERGQALRADIDQAQERLLTSWTQLWPEMKTQLQAQLKDQNLFTQLMNDQVFIEHIKRAFLIEISSRIDLDDLGSKLGESEALADLGGLAFKHVKGTRVIKALFGGAATGVRQGRRQLGQVLTQEEEAGTLIPDLSYCGFKIASIFMPRSVIGLLGHAIDLDSSEVCDATVKSAKGVFTESLKHGGKDLAKQSLDSLLKEREETKGAALGLVSVINEQLKPTVLLEKFWAAISQDEELITHLKTTYGAEGLAKITGALRAVSSSKAFSLRVNKLGAEMKQIAQRGLSALLLDQTGKGPNPLLLAVIQEQLSGQRRPKIHITPGEGDKLSPGHIFKHHEGAH